MPFLSLSLQNIRNLENGTIDLLSKEVYFVGENGQGKTNLLESLYISAYGSSFRTHSDNDILKFGQQEYSIRSFFRNEDGKSNLISVIYTKNRKRIERNGKKITDRKEIVNTIPCVLFCHEDLDFATGEPERRRFFIDQSLSMYDAVYLDILRRYKRVLKTRNLVLKDGKYELLDVYDVHLADFGIEIQEKRRNALFQFNNIFTKLYEEITGIDGVFIRYDASWKSKEKDVILQHLVSKRDIDKVMNTTMCGPHRDRILFVKDGKQFIPTASTGQKRLVSILLRVSQAVYYAQITGKKPVLLMDDVLLELDPDKRQKVTALLPDYDQLFCTFLPGEPYERYKRSGTRIYFIDKGTWHE